jgi:hypothetical protein
MWSELLRELPVALARTSGITSLRVYTEEPGESPFGVPTLDIFVGVDPAIWGRMFLAEDWQFPFDPVTITVDVADAVHNYMPDAGFAQNEMLAIGASRHPTLVHAGIIIAPDNTYIVPPRTLSEMSRIVDGTDVDNLSGEHKDDLWDQLPQWARELATSQLWYRQGDHPCLVRIMLVPASGILDGDITTYNRVIDMNVGWTFVDEMGTLQATGEVAHFMVRYYDSQELQLPS